MKSYIYLFYSYITPLYETNIKDNITGDNRVINCVNGSINSLMQIKVAPPLYILNEFSFFSFMLKFAPSCFPAVQFQ